MPLTSVMWKPILGLGWLKYIWMPSRRQTEKARQELIAKNPYHLAYRSSAMTQAFAKRELTVGTTITMDGKTLMLEGVYSGTEFPEAMVFWDINEKHHVQFTDFGCERDFQIIKK